MQRATLKGRHARPVACLPEEVLRDGDEGAEVATLAAQKAWGVVRVEPVAVGPGTRL